MVIVRLTGGLGNQLFQYAAALRVALITGSPLRLDILSLARDSKRCYSLWPYQISATLAGDAEITFFQGRERLRTAKHALYERIPARWRRWHWVRQPSLRFYPPVLGLQGSVYLDGSWQSERYFGDITDRLRSEFTLSAPLTGRNEALARQIESMPSTVSLHVRRGDYVDHAATQAIHEVCSPDYYAAAVLRLAGSEDKSHVFVFSDDTTWVKTNVHLPLPMTIVDHNPADQAHEDLRLMSLCRHHIIANSSFSWWGAWLGRKPGKMVFAPNRWFNCDGYEIRDIVPADWTLLDFDGRR